jgi:endonuclease/exonuclease/phosphatase (EEP) superfamily protein YafD
VRIAALALGVADAALSLAGFADDRSWLADLAASVRVQLFLLAVVAATLAVAGRSLVGLGGAALALLVNTLVLVPLYTGEPASPLGAARLRIAHVNVQGRAGDFAELRRTLADRRPDVFVVLEALPDWTAQLSDGIGGYRVYLAPGATRGRVVVLARTEVTRVSAPPAPEFSGSALAFDVPLGASTVRVLALHTPSPTTPGRRRLRNEELAAAGEWASGHEGAELVLGDLNVTPWGSAVESLRDAANLRCSADGSGVQATWPALAGPLGIPIDELLYSRELTIVDRDPGPNLGSTHRSLWVTVARAARS